jgi:hypothetical protein
VDRKEDFAERGQTKRTLQHEAGVMFEMAFAWTFTKLIADFGGDSGNATDQI